MLVNGRFLSRRITGVERYGREILRVIAGKLRVVQPAVGKQGLAGHAWEQVSLPRQMQPGEVLWSPANTGPLAVENQVLTVHDLSALKHPEWYAPAFGLWYRMFVPALVRRVKWIVVPSEWVRNDLLARYPLLREKVVVAPGGEDLNRFHPHQPGFTWLPSRYLLFVGSLQPRKNLDALLHAWALIHHHLPGTWLMIAGAWERNFHRVALPENAARVCFPGYIPEAQLPSVYAHARAVVLPSLDEGFGLPVLEAMACGTPVIAAQAGALPEVVGEAGLLFDPYRPEELAARLIYLLKDEKVSRDLAEKGLARANSFTWQHSAAKVLAL